LLQWWTLSPIGQVIQPYSPAQLSPVIILGFYILPFPVLLNAIYHLLPPSTRFAHLTLPSCPAAVTVSFTAVIHACLGGYVAADISALVAEASHLILSGNKKHTHGHSYSDAGSNGPGSFGGLSVTGIGHCSAFQFVALQATRLSMRLLFHPSSLSFYTSTSSPTPNSYRTISPQLLLLLLLSLSTARQQQLLAL
jgi:hypothetical protein